MCYHSGVRHHRVVGVVGVLGDVRQGAAHAHARVRRAAEGGHARLRPPARGQGDVRGRRGGVRVSIATATAYIL